MTEYVCLIRRENGMPSGADFSVVITEEAMEPLIPRGSRVYVSGSTPPLPLEQMKKNSSGEAVWYLQSKLKELGYYTGTVTGTYLNGTVNAVKAFQKDAGMKADGVASVKMLEALYAEELATPVPETPTPTMEVIATPEVQETIAMPEETPVPSDAAEGESL